MRIGVYPGTFDPITFGHMDIIRRAANVVDELVIAVALDTGKAPIFDLETRTHMVKCEIDSLPAEQKKRIIVKPFSGLLVNFVKQNNAHILVRGLRAVSDFEYEFQMAAINTKLNPEVETVFLTASESTHFISSRFVKQIARLGGDVSAFVSENIKQQMQEYFGN